MTRGAGFTTGGGTCTGRGAGCMTGDGTCTGRGTPSLRVVVPKLVEVCVPGTTRGAGLRTKRGTFTGWEKNPLAGAGRTG